MIKAMTTRSVMVAAVLSLVSAGAASGGQTAEQSCLLSLYKAAARYGKCQNKAHGNWSGGKIYSESRLRNCVRKYTASWAKFQAKFAGTGSTCDNPRFQDLGTAVLDRLTNLTWEKKAGGVQAVGATFTWSASGSPSDGTLFTSFLAGLHSACLAGTCDWRIPSAAELQTILVEPYECKTSPCIVPELAPASPGNYWSSTTFANVPTTAWFVNFNLGNVFTAAKSNAFYVRAVRGGLLTP